MDKGFKYLGIISGLSGWIVILVSIRLNPWFIITEHAFSDLGGRLASNPWVFNKGMIFIGIMIIVYGYNLTKLSLNRMSKLGSLFTILTGLALLLIGIYPSGTSPHYLVSIWFFAQGDLSIGAWGLGLWDERKYMAWVFLTLSILGPIGAIIVNWPSIAIVEAYGILLMNIWTVLMSRR